MANITLRDIVEIVALHGVCSKANTYATDAPRYAKSVADGWAKNNPNIAKIVANEPATEG